MPCRSASRILLSIILSASAAAQTASSFARIVDHSAVVTDPAQIASVSKFDVQPLNIDKLYVTRAIGDSAWSPDGKQIAFISNISGRENLWIIDADGGWPTQLTVSAQREATPSWSPNGRWIAYTSDTGGNEKWDIFLVSPRDGQVVNLTNTPDISEDQPSWSPDGEKLAYRVKPHDSPNYEIDVMEVATRRVKHLTSNTPSPWSNSSPIWSRDGKQIVFTRHRADFKDSDVFVAELATGKARKLTVHEGEHNFIATDISPDGKCVLLTSNGDNGYTNTAEAGVVSGKLAWLSSEKWEVRSGKYSPDGRLATWIANVDGSSEISIYDRQKEKSRVLPLGRGVNTLAGAETAFNRDGSRLLYYHNGPASPGDLWVFDLATARSTQITHSLVGGIRSEDMVEPFLVHYPSHDGKWQISAFLYVPYNAERNGKNAAVVFIHGGPAAQMENYFVRSIQYLANQGFFVIVPNFRGSTGYGKAFEDANRFDMGGGDLEDVVSAADWIAKTGYVDPRKIALFGGSYGGYLGMMAATKVPDRWAAAAIYIPFVNWFTEIAHTDPFGREHAIATMGDPVKDKERLHDRSPIFFVDQVKAPVLLLAGGNDPRCPPTEAEQVAAAIRKNKGVVELKIYENEGHGFSRVEDQIDALTRIGEFLKKYDPPEKCGCNLNE